MGPELPTARANHCSVGIGDWLVVIGGNREVDGAFVKTDEIHAAKLVEGVLGAWTLAGHTASPVTECNAATDGKALYVVGGIYDDDADNGAVWSGAFDGTVALAMTNALPSGVLAVSSAAAVHDGVIVLDSEVDADATSTLSYAKRLADKCLGRELPLAVPVRDRRSLRVHARRLSRSSSGCRRGHVRCASRWWTGGSYDRVADADRLGRSEHRR